MLLWIELFVLFVMSVANAFVLCSVMDDNGMHRHEGKAWME